MVRTTTTHLTLAAMLWHAVLGCSWHHTHAAEGAWSCRAATNCCGGSREAAREHDGHLHHAAADHDPQAADAPLAIGEPDGNPSRHAPSRCTEGECKFLRSAGGEGPTVDRDLDGRMLAAAEVAGDRDNPSAHAGDDFSQAALTAVPYLPRCVNTQLWLN